MIEPSPIYDIIAFNAQFQWQFALDCPSLQLASTSYSKSLSIDDIVLYIIVLYYVMLYYITLDYIID